MVDFEFGSVLQVGKKLKQVVVVGSADADAPAGGVLCMFDALLPVLLVLALESEVVVVAVLKGPCLPNVPPIQPCISQTPPGLHAD